MVAFVCWSSSLMAATCSSVAVQQDYVDMYIATLSMVWYGFEAASV